MMNCPMESHGDRELLMDYCSASVDTRKTKALVEHLAACPACAEFVRGQREVWSALEVWEAPPVSADFDRKVYDRIQKEVSWWDRLVRPLRPFGWAHAVPLTAAAGLLVVAGFLLKPPTAVAPGEAALRPDVAVVEAQSAIEEMELLRDFNGLVRADADEPKM